MRACRPSGPCSARRTTSAAAVNSVAGLPGPGRLALKGVGAENGTACCVPDGRDLPPDHQARRARYRLDRHLARRQGHRWRQGHGRGSPAAPLGAPNCCGTALHGPGRRIRTRCRKSKCERRPLAGRSLHSQAKPRVIRQWSPGASCVQRGNMDCRRAGPSNQGRHARPPNRIPLVLVWLSVGLALAADAPPERPGMVYVPAGEFAMGSKADDPVVFDHEKHSETPQHMVKLKAFYIEARPRSRNKQYDELVPRPSSVTSARRATTVRSRQVSWIAATSFCEIAEEASPDRGRVGEGREGRQRRASEHRSTTTPGTTATRSQGTKPVGRRSRTATASTTCSATCASGPTTGSIRATTRRAPRKIRPVPRGRTQAWSAAARSSSTKRSVTTTHPLQPPAGIPAVLSGISLRPGSVIRASGVHAR